MQKLPDIRLPSLSTSGTETSGAFSGPSNGVSNTNREEIPVSDSCECRINTGRKKKGTFAGSLPFIEWLDYLLLNAAIFSMSITTLFE